MKPLDRRMAALDKLLALERSTSKAKPYSEWLNPPVIHIENGVTENVVNVVTENIVTENEVTEKIE